jgi:hypothetical protein
MAHRVCDVCTIKYPSVTGAHKECLVCGEDTRFDAFGLADRDWADKAERALRIIAQLEAKIRFEFPHIDAETYWDDKQEMVHSYDVIKGGGMPDNPDVVTIGPAKENPDGPDDNIYEVIGYSGEKRAYLVRRLRVPSHVDG